MLGGYYSTSSAAELPPKRQKYNGYPICAAPAAERLFWERGNTMVGEDVLPPVVERLFWGKGKQYGRPRCAAHVAASLLGKGKVRWRREASTDACHIPGTSEQVVGFVLFLFCFVFFRRDLTFLPPVKKMLTVFERRIAVSRARRNRLLTLTRSLTHQGSVVIPSRGTMFSWRHIISIFTCDTSVSG